MSKVFEPVFVSLTDLVREYPIPYADPAKSWDKHLRRLRTILKPHVQFKVAASPRTNTCYLYSELAVLNHIIKNRAECNFWAVVYEENRFKIAARVKEINDAYAASKACS